MRRENKETSILGVVGGLGPLASAEFLRTIYEYSLGEREQESPRVLLYSDPTFPDRTEAFLKGNGDALLEQLISVLRALRGMNAARIVICCMTIHYLLPRLPHELRASVISLLDVIADGLANAGKKYLLICSNGTRQLGLFESHPQKSLFEKHLIFPSSEDQNHIHRHLIYPIKRNPDLRPLIVLLESLLKKYEVNSFVAGCSETHLLAKHITSSNGHPFRYECIDPLAIIARRLANNCW